MRICLYTATALPKIGGQEYLVDALAREMQTLGHDVTVLAPTPRGALKSKANDAALPYRVVRHPRYISTRRWMASYVWFLRRANRKYGPFDIWNAHEAYPTGWLAVRAARTTGGAPVVITSQGGDLYENNVRIVKPGVLRRCVEALEQATALVSVGRFTEANFHRLTAKLPPIFTIPNGAYVEQFSHGSAIEPTDIAITKPYMLFLGRLHPRKGVDLIVEALAQCPGVRFVMVGAGDERQRIESRVRELRLEDRITFLGARMGPEKTWLFRNAQAVVMPSRGWEGLPLVAIEAAAAGRAVIASRIAGLDEVVQDGVTGQLFTEESVEELAAAIRRLWTDPALAEQWGANAQAAVRRFDWEIVVEQYLDVYRRCLSLRTPPR